MLSPGSEKSGRAKEPRFDAPIFVVGAPRSGTTLLRNMLNRHPAIAMCFETQFHHLVYRRRRAFGDLSDLRNRERLVKEYLATRRVQAMRMDGSLEETLLREGTSYAAFFAAFLRCYAQSQGKTRCGDKTPQHALFTETLCEWYPDARIIHILRDPRDVVASLMRMTWAPHNLLINAGTWVQCNLGAWQSRLRPQYLLVRYEELVTRPEAGLRRICAFIDEDYSPAMLMPAAVPEAHRPQLRRSAEPVTISRIGSWRDQLTPDDVALIEWRVGPHMQTFGYEPAGGAPSRWRIGTELVSAVFDAASRHIGAFPAAWYTLRGSTNIGKEEAAKRQFRRRRESSTGATVRAKM